MCPYFKQDFFLLFFHIALPFQMFVLFRFHMNLFGSHTFRLHNFKLP